MTSKTYTHATLNFRVVLILLAVLSIAGMFAPERISWLQDSTILRWTVAILLGLVAGYILFPFSLAGYNWKRSNGKAQCVEERMIADLKWVLFFHPLIGLLMGWILGWEVARIIRVLSFITFIAMCASFFGAIRQLKLNKKTEKSLAANESVSG